MPVIRTQERVAALAAGDTLVVHCSDPGALHDIPAWCRINGHELLSATRSEREITITLRVTG